MKKKINQKLINLIEYYSIFNANLLLSDKPIKRNADNQSAELSFSGSKIQKLEKLKKKILVIKNCDLKKNATNVVFGDGNINANIMIVGEGPGAQEDIIGKPFIGRAGKLLDKMLESINLDRKKVYISNIVNYRPPENRRPTDLEISRYLPYIQKHIEIINPKILFLLGSTALNTLIGDEEVISVARGKWIQKEIGTIKPWIIVSFHPAFLMRQPQQKKLAWIDLKMIRDKIKNFK
jgi:uracil-DNA glycosylase family 4